MDSLCPLRFEPLFRQYIWGGRRLGELLQKAIGAGDDYAESWEIVDHEDDQSVVTNGPLAGKSLRQLIAEIGGELLGQSVLDRIAGDNVPIKLRDRFPLLLKFLDANQHLSVQVHPNDRFGATLSPPDLGKTEAWYVLHALPESKIYAGLKTGITEADFRTAVAEGQTEQTLHSFQPRTGDCIFIPAGTMHAIGAGLLIAEIQQASNTTFRVYDWGRVDSDGQPRPLHIEQAIEVTDFSRGPVDPALPRESKESAWSELVSCDKFVMNKAVLDRPTKVCGDGRFHILAVIGGELEIEFDPANSRLQVGQTVLLPSSLPAVELRPGDEGVELLEIHVPY